jgi:adenylate cyclase
MKEPVERRLAAILAADVAGYSRLMGADEEGTLERLKAHRREFVDPKIKEHRGRIVKTTGDGMLVEFPSVVDAVRCAVEVQRAMDDRNAEIPEDKRIIFRIGVNLGDVIIDGDDIYGDGVNIAARLEALAEPGGICISRVVRDQIRDKLPYPFDDMGEQSVKNIARPVRAYAMTAIAVASTPLVAVPPQPNPARRRIGPRRAAIAASVVAIMGIGIAVWWAWPQGNSPMVSVQAPAAATPQNPPAVVSTPAPRLSIVVLPFANLSSDPDQEYFVDGITDDLTTDLSRISDSFVIARNTAFTYKGKAQKLRLGAAAPEHEVGPAERFGRCVAAKRMRPQIHRCRPHRSQGSADAGGEFEQYREAVEGIGRRFVRQQQSLDAPDRARHRDQRVEDMDAGPGHPSGRRFLQ